MPHLLSLLLQTPAPALLLEAGSATLQSMLPGYIFPVIMLAVALYTIYRKEHREDGKTIPQRMLAIETDLAVHEKRQQGFQQEIEHVADQAKQAREKMAEMFTTNLRHQNEQHNSRFAALEKDSAEVQKLRDGMAEVRAEMKRLPKIEEKLDRLTEILTRKIA